MAETSEKVMDKVRQEIQKNKDVPTDELYAKAKKVDSSIGDLTLRQFHARYPLQVKRKMAAASGKKRKSRKRTTRRRARGSGGVDRAAIRASLVNFAREVTAAEGTAGVIDAVEGVDKYVDQIVKAVGGK